MLANWNSARFLHDAIESVVRQTFGEWEAIIVDTGSTDGSRAILERWAATDNRIQIILIPHRLNCPAALNIGLAEAKGEFVARIESDDLWQPPRLERQVAFLDCSSRTQIGVCGTDALLINDSGRVLGTKRYPPKHQDCLKALWYRNPFCHSSVLLRRDVFTRCGGYDNTFPLVEDLELWFRAGRQWELCNLPEPLVCYRVWPGGLTSRRLRTLIWSTYRVRSRAVRELGYTRPRLAALYSLASLGAALLPAWLVRSLFQLVLDRLADADGSMPLCRESETKRLETQVRSRMEWDP